MGNKTTKLLLRLLNSKYFIIFILVVFIVQALWVALSFAFPIVYDELYHRDIINIYSFQLSPFITSQPHAFDYLRDLRNESSFIYHYLMSFPYRIIVGVTKDLFTQIVALRIINIAMFSAGMYFFYRLFIKLGIRRAYINVSLLLFISIPIVSLIAATINYDNMLFMLAPLCFTASVDFLKSKSLNLKALLLVIIWGCFTSLANFTFLPIFAAIVIYLGVVIYLRYRKHLLKNIKVSFKKMRHLDTIGLAVALSVTVGLFCAIYIKNVIIYHTPTPACVTTLGEARCQKSAVVVRDETAYNTRAQRPLMVPFSYADQWSQQMISSSASTEASTTRTKGIEVSPSPRIYYNFFGFGVVIFILIIAASWSLIPKTSSIYFASTVALVSVGSVFIFNALTYYKLHLILAIQPRYLFLAMPIVLVFGVWGLSLLLKKMTRTKVAIFIVSMLIIILGGGGVETHILGSNTNWYWQNSTVQGTDRVIWQLTHHIVLKD